MPSDDVPVNAVNERKRAVEALIDAAARWGWDQARAHSAPFEPPVVAWTADNRPYIVNHGRP